MKKYIKYLLLVLLSLPILVKADSERFVGEYGSYTDFQARIKEVMAAYYMRGPYIQYNVQKAQYGNWSPEQATEQNNEYMVCAAFVYDCYNEAFGFDNNIDGFPKAVEENGFLSSATQAYNAIKAYKDIATGIVKPGIDSKTRENGENAEKYLLYYHTSSSEYNAGFDYTDLRPGDVIAYTGHVLMVYDKFKRSDGTEDVLLLNSTKYATSSDNSQVVITSNALTDGDEKIYIERITPQAKYAEAEKILNLARPDNKQTIW